MLFLIRTAPYGCGRGREALDAAITAAAFEQEVSLLYLGDGVFHLLRNQDGSGIMQKTAGAQIAALPYYDVEQILCCSEDLRERGLGEEDLIAEARSIKRGEARNLLASEALTLSF